MRPGARPPGPGPPTAPGAPVGRCPGTTSHRPTGRRPHGPHTNRRNPGPHDGWSSDGLRPQPPRPGLPRPACRPSWTPRSSPPSPSTPPSAHELIAAGRPARAARRGRGPQGPGPRRGACGTCSCPTAPSRPTACRCSTTPRWPSSPGWSPEIAPEALNCAAPDTGQHGDPAHVRHARAEAALARARCCAGEIRSAFSMTEPEVASSDAANIETRIERVTATST